MRAGLTASSYIQTTFDDQSPFTSLRALTSSLSHTWAYLFVEWGDLTKISNQPYSGGFLKSEGRKNVREQRRLRDQGAQEMTSTVVHEKK